MLDFSDSTVSFGYMYDHALLTPPAIISEERPALFGDSTDLLMPHILKRYEIIHAGISATSSHTPQSPLSSPATPSFDPWVWQTREAIAAHRGLELGWDGASAPPPSDALLDTAEILAIGFSELPVSHRAQFSVDTLGTPSYSAYNDDVYLHLTIDAPDVISWYTVIDGVDRFEDEVPVNPLDVGNLVKKIMSI